jgi:hypothetical protein
MHLEASTTRVNALVGEGIEVMRTTKPQGSEKRQVASHKKYDF